MLDFTFANLADTDFSRSQKEHMPRTQCSRVVVRSSLRWKCRKGSQFLPKKEKKKCCNEEKIIVLYSVVGSSDTSFYSEPGIVLGISIFKYVRQGVSKRVLIGLNCLEFDLSRGKKRLYWLHITFYSTTRDVKFAKFREMKIQNCPFDTT